MKRQIKRSAIRLMGPFYKKNNMMPVLPLGELCLYLLECTKERKLNQGPEIVQQHSTKLVQY